MLPVELSAWLFLAGALAAVGLHLLLIFGAPIGFMTMGGRHQGVLPISARGTSLFQALLLLCMALVVLQGAGVVSPPLIPTRGWMLWLVVAISALSLVANTITPSVRERWFGMPVTAALLIGSLGVALGG